MKRLLLALLTALPLTLSAQPVTYTGQVIDAATNEGVAFARVGFAGSRRGTLTDVDGRFTLQDSPADSLIISSITHKRLVLVRPGAALGRIALQPRELTQREVVIRAQDSIAVAIIRRAIANREANDPERSAGFSYKSYNRLSIGFLNQRKNPDKPGEPLFAPDTILPLIPLESVTERRFAGSDDRNQERVEGAQVIGLAGLSFGLVSSNLQDFSFYRDRVKLLDVAFVSPLHTNAPRLYWFTLRDSTVNEDGSTTYIIDYVPRASGEQAFRGFIQLRTPHYALEIVQADLRPQTNAAGIEQGRIQQVYQPAGREGRWFPYQYAMDLRLFPQGTPPTQRLHIVGKSYLRDIRWEVPELPRRFTSVDISANAGERDSTFWRQARPFELTSDEARVARLLDSAAQKAPFINGLMRQTEFLVQGEVAIGKISFDLGRIGSLYNRVEGLRVPLALTTNTRFSQYVRLGAYGVWGALDHTWKYGGSARWMPGGQSDTYVGLSYQDDIFETGGHRLTPNTRRGLWQIHQNADPLRALFLNRMDYRRRMQLEAGARLSNSLEVRGVVRQDDIEVQRAFREVLPGLREHIGEAELTLRIAPGEQLARKSGVPFVLKSGKPVLVLRGTRGFATQSGAGWNYWKYEASLSTLLDLHTWGALLVQGSAHQVDGTAPYANLFSLPGMLMTDASRTAFESGYAFGTVPVQRYMGSRVAMGTAMYRLPIRIGKPTSIVQPIFYAVHRSGWSELPAAARAEAALRAQTDAPLGLHESGLLITGLMDRLPPPANFQVTAGVLYRHGPYADATTWQNNLFFTLGVAQRF